MTQHYTRNTIEASSWCNPCGKNTPHSVSGNRLGACLACLGKRQQQHDELAMKAELYEERAGILEFCANLPRAQAELEAHSEIFGDKKLKQGRMF